MTEQVWLACHDPRQMLAFLEKENHSRKVRLVGCAACRRIWDLMRDARCKSAIEASEQFADGLISESALDGYSAGAEEAFEDTFGEHSPDAEVAASTAHAASYASSPSLALDVLLEGMQVAAEIAPKGLKGENAAQSDLIRDIFGNPFRPVAFDRAWRTDTALSLARQMYDSRNFGAMPILADALQDAGCDNADILNHCRDPATHVRGCWVVDLVLGKE